MEFLIVGLIFLAYSLYLFIFKSTNSRVNSEEAKNYFFDKKCISKNDKIIQSTIRFYKNKNGITSAKKYSNIIVE